MSGAITRDTVDTSSDEYEWGMALYRAFVVGRADFVVITSRRQKFLIEAAMYGQRMGWLTGKLIQHDEQSSEMQYRLTDAGREQMRLAAEDMGAMRRLPSPI